MTLPLHNVKVLVTQPKHKADNLCKLIQERGGEPIRFPAVEIVTLEKPLSIEVDIAIFTNNNAVKFLPEKQKLPTEIFALGKITIKLLKKRGHEPIYVPPPYDSEALFSAPQLKNIVGKKIAIFEGQSRKRDDIRKILLETLRQRSAEIECISVCKHICPSNFDDKVRADIITITSLAGLKNLLQMLPYDWVYEVPIIFTDQNLREKAVILMEKRIREVCFKRALEMSIYDELDSLIEHALEMPNLYDWVYKVSMNVTGDPIREKALTLMKERVREDELVREKAVSLICEAWLEYTLAAVSKKKERVGEVGFKRALEMSMADRPLWISNPWWVLDVESEAREMVEYHLNDYMCIAYCNTDEYLLEAIIKVRSYILIW